MGSRPFELNKDELFITGHRPFKLSNGLYSGIIRVYELRKPDHHNILTEFHWSSKPDLVYPNSPSGYNSLLIFGQPVDFDKLVQDLCRSRLRVNRRGYCFFQLREGTAETAESYGTTFYRMNDLWKWGDYGINVDSMADSLLMNWDRLYILGGDEPTRVLDSDDREIDQELEATKSQLNGKTIENKILNDKVIMLNSDICKKNAENLAFAEQVKKLQVDLENARKYPPAPDPKKPAVPCTVFILKSIPFTWPNYNMYTMYWTVKSGVPKTLTPTHEPVNARFPIPVTFNLIPGESFDVNHWFYVRVRERSAPILIYEGNACSLSVGGYDMTSPITSSTIINWGQFVDLRQEHFDFAPVVLVGSGPRIAILQW